ncbi:hypothetical protein MKW92_012377 [Papaver armeniacum]|nr:hypothetical protein MKW92_012377 [Papaver armeniacum]
MNKDGLIKYASYKSISIDDQELLECQRKKYNDSESIGARMFRIDARHHREPSRVHHKINNVHCNPTTASENKPIEPKKVMKI